MEDDKDMEFLQTLLGSADKLQKVGNSFLWHQFAGQALCGITRSVDPLSILDLSATHIETIVQNACDLADAMVAEMNKRGKGEQ